MVDTGPVCITENTLITGLIRFFNLTTYQPLLGSLMSNIFYRTKNAMVKKKKRAGKNKKKRNARVKKKNPKNRSGKKKLDTSLVYTKFKTVDMCVLESKMSCSSPNLKMSIRKVVP